MVYHRRKGILWISICSACTRVPITLRRVEGIKVHHRTLMLPIDTGQAWQPEGLLTTRAPPER